ncbi:hypothetical protein DEJ23_00400 [Curtobacterium sp. MCSS17_008]|nr:hypothetical protein DEJ23_00400 [Curtobacterium sp. MCSS17_008]
MTHRTDHRPMPSQSATSRAVRSGPCWSAIDRVIAVHSTQSTTFPQPAPSRSAWACSAGTHSSAGTVAGTWPSATHRCTATDRS